MTIWGWTRHDWGDLHTWFAYAVLALVMIHLLLHWRWLWYTAWPTLKWPVLIGLLAGLLLIGAVWMLPVERAQCGEQAARGERHGFRGGDPPP